MHSIIDFKVMGDARGSLVAIENDVQIPFNIKRIFYIFNTIDDVARGCHANRDSQFVLISVQGSCKIKLRYPQDEIIISLDTPSKGLWLDKMVWKEMYDFSKDSVLLVISSHAFNKDEYINDYQLFLKELQNVK